MGVKSFFFFFFAIRVIQYVSRFGLLIVFMIIIARFRFITFLLFFSLVFVIFGFNLQYISWFIVY